MPTTTQKTEATFTFHLGILLAGSYVVALAAVLGFLLSGGW